MRRHAIRFGSLLAALTLALELAPCASRAEVEEQAPAGAPSEEAPKTRGVPRPEKPSDPKPQESTAPPADTAASGIPVYVRPRGAAGGREGGGTRSSTAMELVALIPADHAALTTREQPMLFWYLAEPTTARVDVLLNRGLEEKPLIEKTLAGPFAAGTHALDLAALGVKLEPEVVYKWYVQIVPEPSRRSKDVFSGGTLQRVTPSPDLSAALAEARPEERAAIFAQHGIWVDALAEVAAEVAADPQDRQALREQTALLEQIGLARAAGVPIASQTKP